MPRFARSRTILEEEWLYSRLGEIPMSIGVTSENTAENSSECECGDFSHEEADGGCLQSLQSLLPSWCLCSQPQLPEEEEYPHTRLRWWHTVSAPMSGPMGFDSQRGPFAFANLQDDPNRPQRLIDLFLVIGNCGRSEVTVAAGSEDDSRSRRPQMPDDVCDQGRSLKVLLRHPQALGRETKFGRLSAMLETRIASCCFPVHDPSLEDLVMPRREPFAFTILAAALPPESLDELPSDPMERLYCVAVCFDDSVTLGDIPELKGEVSKLGSAKEMTSVAYCVVSRHPFIGAFGDVLLRMHDGDELDFGSGGSEFGKTWSTNSFGKPPIPSDVDDPWQVEDSWEQIAARLRHSAGALRERVPAVAQSAPPSRRSRRCYTEPSMGATAAFLSMTLAVDGEEDVESIPADTTNSSCALERSATVPPRRTSRLSGTGIRVSFASKVRPSFSSTVRGCVEQDETHNDRVSTGEGKGPASVAGVSVGASTAMALDRCPTIGSTSRKFVHGHRLSLKTGFSERRTSVGSQFSTRTDFDRFLYPSPQQMDSPIWANLQARRHSELLLDWAALPLFQHLSVDTVLQTVCALLLELRVLVVAQTIALGSAVVLGLNALLWPFRWQHLLLPVCPVAVQEDIIDAPVPFLCALTHDVVRHRQERQMLRRQHISVHRAQASTLMSVSVKQGILICHVEQGKVLVPPDSSHLVGKLSVLPRTVREKAPALARLQDRLFEARESNFEIRVGSGNLRSSMPESSANATDTEPLQRIPKPSSLQVNRESAQMCTELRAGLSELALDLLNASGNVQDAELGSQAWLEKMQTLFCDPAKRDVTEHPFSKHFINTQTCHMFLFSATGDEDD